MNANDAVFIKFLKEKIKKGGGCIEFQNISGHLSQLSPELRAHVGTKRIDFLKFLRKYEDLFSIGKDGLICLRKSEIASSENSSESNSSDKNVSKITLPKNVSNKEDVVVKVSVASSETNCSNSSGSNSLDKNASKIAPSKNIANKKEGIIKDSAASFEKICSSDSNSRNKNVSKIALPKNISNENEVVIKSSAASSEKNCSNSSENNSSDKNVSRITIPKNISNKDGIVFKVSESIGFISSKDPKAIVSFTPACFYHENISLLTNFVEPGQKVCFNAKRDHKANSNAKRDGSKKLKDEATKVWFPKKVENEVLHPEGFRKLRKTRETGLYDPVSSEGDAKVEKVFDTHGVLIVDDDPQNTVFFCKDVICNVDNITNLIEILKPGDIVSYNAVRGSKKNAEARWKATKVWLKKQADFGSGKRSNYFKTTENHNDEKATQNILKNEVGKIYLYTTGIVIKFGKRLENLADAGSCLFYTFGEQVQEVRWEFSDGDSVNFDAIQIKSAPGWRASLVWTGARPNVVLPMSLEDHETVSSEESDDISEFDSVSSDDSVSSEESHGSSTTSHSRRPNQLTSHASNSNKTSKNSVQIDSGDARKGKQQQVKKFTNWGDSPYPEEQDTEPDE